MSAKNRTHLFPGHNAPPGRPRCNRDSGSSLGSCGLESLDGLSFSKHRFGTTVKLDQIQMVRAQPAQTSLDAFQQGTTRPIFASDPARMAAFRKEIVVAPAFADCFSD